MDNKVSRNTQVIIAFVCFAGLIVALLCALALSTANDAVITSPDNLGAHPLWLIFSKALDPPVLLSNFMLYKKLMAAFLTGTLMLASWLYIMEKQ